ncbi:Helix-hairpin-helix motif-containing protein [Actinoplanes philippinensis]|uniref:Helix-hairpin-helix motif-containing protein n=1 Tax=Actinoplanes philippinensis TaxID=35752 RepID=A0A1I2FJH6_9ACTN|nr:Helix-hairpin-helix motif-containing protein [Actinoplanes philippinensis]
MTGWWFLVPLFTCGYGTPVMVLIAAARLRSSLHTILGVGYVAVIASLILARMIASPGYASDDENAVVGLVSLVLWIAGTIHVAALQMRVRERWFRTAARYQIPSYPPPPWQHGTGVDPALAAAQWRAARRQEARELQASRPAMANELMIGRPDLPGREYDDGGLVDVNHVPADWLVRYLTIDRDLADRIVEARDLHNGFTSAEELVVYCEGLTPAKLDLFRDRLVFVPR